MKICKKKVHRTLFMFDSVFFIFTEMESANSRLQNRAEKLRSQLETLKKEINVANAFLQEVLDRNVRVVEELESVTVTQIYLREYTKIQKFLLKHINFVTEVNCNLEILNSDDLPMLNCLSGPQYSLEYSLHEGSSESDQVFQFSADKKVSNVEYNLNQEKLTNSSNIYEKAEVSEPLVSLGSEVAVSKKEENPKNNAIQSPKKKVLDPDTWTEAPVFVPKLASTVKVPDVEEPSIKVAPKSTSPALSAVSNPTIPTVSASALYKSAPIQPQTNPYHPYQVYYPRFGIQAPPPGIHVPPLVPVTVTWTNPYPPKPALAVTRNPIKIEAPKPKPDKKKIEFPETTNQSEKNAAENVNQLTKTTLEIKNETASIAIKNNITKAAPENVVKNEIKSREEEILENNEEKKENGKENKDDFSNVVNEKETANDVVNSIEYDAILIPEMKISREPGKKYQVVFNHLVSPGEFYVQILCPELSLMREMNKELEGYFKSEKVPDRKYQSNALKNSEKKDLAKKEIGRYGLCYTVDDPSWGRVEIVDWRHEKDDDVISVFFIDYGDTKNISLSYAQPMVPKFKKYPKFAQRCHLAEIYPADCTSEDSTIKWSSQSVTMFEILLECMSHDFSCQIIVCKHDGCYDEKSLPVKFYVSEDGNCVNDKLIEFDYAVEFRKSSSSADPEKPEKDLVGALKTATPEPFLPGEVISIQVTCLLKLNKFYCVREYGENEEDELQKLVMFMNKPENVKDMLVLTDPPAVNQIVIGKYEIDDLWYRAKVTKSEPSLDRYKLLFLDYGNTQVVNLENIRKMERKFLSFPFQLIECYLSGIELLDDGKSEPAMNYFYERVKEGDVSIKIVSCKSEVSSCYEVVLYDKDGIDIGENLASKKFVNKT